MKSIPPEVLAAGPPGTQWFGGGVDRSTMTLRVIAETVEVSHIAGMIGRESDSPKAKGWRLSAPEATPADLDAQIAWLFGQLTLDLAVWRQLTEAYKVDLFSGLFLDEPNRGVSLTPGTLAAVAARGITLGFDIYGPVPPAGARTDPG